MDIKAFLAAYPEQADQLWYRVLDSMNAETQGFVTAIVIFTLLFHVFFTQNVRAKSPAFLTTLGILGTFIGIAIGLMDFDADNVQGSVPKLIEGVKTAVWASACGVFCALTVKFRDIVFSRRRKSSRTSVATIDDLADSLKAIENVLGAVEQALVGDSEPSLLLKLQALQDSQQATLDGFGQSLAQFREHLAESNVKVLVASLNEVIRDFNVKLNEQFGDNFKQLNEATGKILEWQQQYSAQVATMVEVQGDAARNMQVASEQYKALLGEADIFKSVAGSLFSLLQGLETQRTELTESLTQLASLTAAAAEGLPKLEPQISELTRQLTDGMRTANSEFNTHVRMMVEQTKSQVLELDNALTEELTKALDSFGRQLASLSSKFAQDYGPITERLQQVLRIAS